MKRLDLVNSKLIPYIISIILCVILLIFLYNLSEVDITKPIIYQGDGISASYLMKTVDDTGWYLENPYVGGGYGGNFYDYYMSDGLSFLLVKIISIFTDNVFIIYNLFYFFTYVLVTITCLYALIKLGVKKSIAIVCALLYAFLPFHQQRMAHIWLEPYFVLPLVGLVAIWIVTDQLKVEHKGKSNIIKCIWNNSNLRRAFIISFLASSTGLYYAFFSCCIYAIAFLINCLKRSGKQQIFYPVYFIFTTVAGVIFNIIPHVIYIIQNGSNPVSELATRSSSESETYGLKMIQLILPRQGHRVPFLSNIANSYISVSPLTNENATAALGIIGSIGFILLMLNIFNLKSKDKLENRISLLNLGTLLIATIGGVGAIFSYLVKNPMRCYNRISLMIAFFSLLYIGMVISRFVENHSKRYVMKMIYYICCIVLLAFGIYDQTVSYTAAEQKQTIEEYKNDNDFVSKIEKAVPPGSMIYQLPHKCFPSGGEYDELKGYLNSKNLVWSYPSMQGRKQDLWEHSINQLPMGDMIRKLSLAGYEGIYIDTALYGSQGKLQEVTAQVSSTLGVQPIQSENGRLLFFSMLDYNDKLKSLYSDNDYEELKNNVYTILDLVYLGEFSILEQNSEGDTWHWCGSDGLLKIVNPKSENVKLNYTTLAIVPTGDSSISISVNGGTPTSFNVGSTAKPIELEIELKPGENSILFHCDAPRYESGSDTRELVFYLWNTKAIY